MVLSASPSYPNPVDGFEDFFRGFQSSPKHYKYREEVTRVFANQGTSLVFLFEDLMHFNPALAQELRENPEEILVDAVEAFKNLLRVEAGGAIDEDLNYFVRVTTLQGACSVLLRGLRAKHIDKLISIRGILTRATPIKPQLVTATFECDVCHTQIPVEQLQPKITMPLRCSSPSCTNRKSFTLIGRDSDFIDWQSVQVQELQEELPPGRTPTTTQVIVTHDLVDRSRPGDRVKIMGIWKSVPVEMGKGQKSTIFRTFIKCNNIESLEEENDESYPSEEEIEQIRALAQEPNIQNKIARSVASTIFGHYNLKMASALLLFGGVSKVKQNGMKIRGDIHALFVGDPGTGKSQILRSSFKIAPRSVYTSGKGSSGVGLTAAVLKDIDTGGMTLEAGAMVLADGGIACIDEFDKMRNEDRVAIHEAMEQQSVSIAKAGIVATLNCRTSVLAAANPHLGRYNINKTVAENIRLPPSILSRFDLIFIVRDQPDTSKDDALAEFILDLHMKETELPSFEEEDEETEEEGSITAMNLIPVELLRKYIRYARKHCHPRLTPAAAKKIKEFYLELRALGQAEGSPVAIVARTLEGIIRLSEAHAKMALRDQVLESDVKEILKIMKKSMKDLNYDPDTGQYDVDRILVGKSSSKVKQIQKILDILKDMEEMNNGSPVKEDALIDLLLVEDLKEDFIRESLTQLKKDGEIYSPKQGFVKRTQV